MAVPDGRKSIKIWFTGFQNEEKIRASFLYKVISRKYSIDLTEDCDYLFVDYRDYVYYKSYLKHECVRIFYSSENIYPDFSLVDYALCPNRIPIDDRFLWLPVYWWFPQCWTLINNGPRKAWNSRSKFCCFIVSNNNAEPISSENEKSMREHFFDTLSNYKTVDSPGRYKQNMAPIPVNPKLGLDFYSAKISFMEDYRFALTFENSKAPGYCTEKLVHGLIAGCIPIYWGDPLVTEQFDDRCFIHVKAEGDLSTALEEIKKIEENPNEAAKYLKNLKSYTKMFETICREEYVLDFLEKIFAQTSKEAIRRSRYYLTRDYERELTKGIEQHTIFNSSTEEIQNVELPLSAFLPHGPNVSVTNMEDSLLVDVKNDFKGYVQTFGGSFKNPPPKPYMECAIIPHLAKKMSAKVDYLSDRPLKVAAYLMQYDGVSQIRSDYKELVERTAGSCLLESKIANDAQTFKLAIRFMRPDLVAEVFTVKVTNIKVSFTISKDEHSEVQ